MKLVTAIIKPFKLDEVREALGAVGFVHIVDVDSTPEGTRSAGLQRRRWVSHLFVLHFRQSSASQGVISSPNLRRIALDMYPAMPMLIMPATI